MKNKPGQRVKLMFSFPHPVGLVEVRKKVIKRNLPINKVRAIITSRYTVVLEVRLWNITYDGFKNIIKCDHSQYRSVFVYYESGMQLRFLKFLHHLVSRIILRHKQCWFHQVFEKG